jgi:hypothetical protein
MLEWDGKKPLIVGRVPDDNVKSIPFRDKKTGEPKKWNQQRVFFYTGKEFPIEYLYNINDGEMPLNPGWYLYQLPMGIKEIEKDGKSNHSMVLDVFEFRKQKPILLTSSPFSDRKTSTLSEEDIPDMKPESASRSDFSKK